MSERAFDIFCYRVCSVIRWRAARRPIAAELTAHLEDHTAALEADGLTPDTAVRRAVESMGDPYALGAQLDRVHPPTLPRLSLVLSALAALVLVAGLVIGARDGTGLFALSGISPQFPDLPFRPSDAQELVTEGAASGGGSLGEYTLTPSGGAGLVHIRHEFDALAEDFLQLQVPLTITSGAPWFPVPEDSALSVAYTDDAGGSGGGYFSTEAEYLLGVSGCLRLSDPTPGAEAFTITVSTADGAAVTFAVTLDQEVSAP